MADMDGNEDPSAQLSSPTHNTSVFHLQQPDDSALCIFSCDCLNSKTNSHSQCTPYSATLQYLTLLACSVPPFSCLFFTETNSGLPSPCPSLEDLIYCSYWENFSSPPSFSTLGNSFPSVVLLLNLSSGLIYS